MSAPGPDAVRMAVLIAEDDETLRALLQAAVAASGHECITARDGVEALELFDRHAPDAVISDWLMPDMDGPTLCQAIRERGGRYTYVALLTGLDASTHADEGIAAGADDFLAKPPDTAEIARRLTAASRLVTWQRALAAEQTKLEQQNVDLHAAIRRDALTGVGNRLRLDEDLRVHCSRAARYGDAYAIALYDIDHFKSYNDTAGHQGGDRVLVSVAETLKAEIRGGDAVYRYGGEEFVVLLAHADARTAHPVGDRLRAAVEARAIEHPGTGGVVTVSAGVATVGPRESCDPYAVIGRADAALYAAKEAGRNQVCLADAATQSAR